METNNDLNGINSVEEDEMMETNTENIVATGEGNNSSDLLRQIEREFSCLGTTDRDVLIKQLQKIIGPQLNSYAAQFFLDMNDWNLQLAVGSYFDLVGNNNPSEISIATNIQSTEMYCNNSIETNIVGSTNTFSNEFSQNEIFIQKIPTSSKIFTIGIKNNGTCQWPIGTHLRLLNQQPEQRIQVELLEPNVDSLLTLSIDDDNLVTVTPHPVHDDDNVVPQPIVEDCIKLSWQMCTPDGYLFGQILTLIISINNVDSVAKQFTQMST